MDGFRKVALWVVLPLGIVWDIFGYVSMASRWKDVPNFNYGMFLVEGGFWTLLIPIIIWLCFYFRAYYLLILSLVIVVMAIGWGAWY